MPAESRLGGQRTYGYRSEACLPPLKGFWLALGAAPALGSIAEPRASRGPEFALVSVPPALVHRAKSRESSLAEQVVWRKEQRLYDPPTPVLHPNPVRRQKVDEDKKW